ncbi:MAG: hypothetical protein CL521_04815 [Actinobacteria bacterium]|nr:hypothetical protein [Actinomycetota bacterium]
MNLLIIKRAHIATIMSLATPIILSMFSQNLLTLVDTMMIGYLGNVALAAAGIGGFLNYLLISAAIGLSTGIQALTARQMAKGDRSSLFLTQGNRFILWIGIPLTILMWVLTEPIMGLLSQDPDVIRQGSDYFHWRVLGIALMGIQIAYRGFWTGIHSPMNYFKILLVTHALNIGLNFLLIFGGLGIPALGLIGAGIGSSLSLLIGDAILWLHLKHKESNGQINAVAATSNERSALIKYSLPLCLQELGFSLGIFVFLWIIAQLGTEALAIGNVLITISLTAILPGVGFGIAAVTLTSHAIGAKEFSKVKQWTKETAMIGGGGIFLLAMLGLLLAEPILSLFIKDSTTLLTAIPLFRLDCLFIGFQVTSIILLHALKGMGYTRLVLLIILLSQWGLQLPFAYLIGVHLSYSLLGIWMVSVSFQLCLFLFLFILLIRIPVIPTVIPRK